MKIQLSPSQRYALASKLASKTGIETFDIDFMHRVGDVSGESTRVSVNGRWLHRDGTWHDEPEPPSSRWVVRRDDSRIPYFKAYINGGIQWTERREDAQWWALKEAAQDFVITDEGLVGCMIEEVAD